jgi:peptide methionine sulfoxide reductase MsrB
MNQIYPVAEEEIITHKEMEAPYAAEYDNSYQRGTFICKHSDEPFFSTKNNFNAVCGWPSFDKIFPKAITSLADTDGTKTEIQCDRISSI